MAKEAKKAAAPKKGAAAAARDEAKEEAEKVEDEPTTIEVRGLTLTLPDKLPATFAFDVAEMQEAATVFAVIRLLTTFLGGEQVVAMRSMIARGEVSDDDLEDFLTEVLEAILAEFGLSLGE